MNVVMVTAEAFPFAKTGGLGDVVPSLAEVLARRGHDVTVILPYWPAGVRNRTPGIIRNDLSTSFPHDPANFSLREHQDQAGLRYLLIDQPGYFDRAGLYSEPGGEAYADNARRFAFLGRAALEVMRSRSRPIDILHLHDWHTGLIPLQAESLPQSVPALRRTGIVFTIHNAAYQGRFGQQDWSVTGLPEGEFTFEGIEYWGDWSSLKAGIISADMITTVSPTYAAELLTPEHGMGMEGVLAQRASRLVGIVNGIDIDDWNPASDPNIETTYDVESFLEGKAKNKRRCQEEFGLPTLPDVPLVGIVGRLAHQKGIDILSELAKHLLNREIQLAILGQGEPAIQDLVTQCARCYPDRVAARIGFDEPLARRIFAGSDWFFMPSRFEPCGLSQLYAMRYGSIPIAHSVGGLADTIADASPSAIENQTATGFLFHDLTEQGVIGAFTRATEAYRHPRTWNGLITTAMRTDWSWDRSVAPYERVYGQAALFAQARSSLM
jgi:starch synthase